MKKIYFFVISLLVFTNFASAATFKNNKELRKFSDSVMEMTAAGDTVEALSTLGPYTIISETGFAEFIENSKAQMDQYVLQYGESVGFEFISEEKIGKTLVKLVYIQKMEKHALPWVFHFYKSPQGWLISTFIWDDQLLSVFK